MEAALSPGTADIVQLPLVETDGRKVRVAKARPTRRNRQDHVWAVLVTPSPPPYYYGKGRGECPGFEEVPYIQATLKDVTEKNTEGVKIHTVAQGDFGAEQMLWLRELAVMNGGTFHKVTR